MSLSEAVQKHKQYLFPAVSMYYQEPIELVRGEGSYVWDNTGKKYLDAFGGVLTVSVGHANPKITEAVVAQIRKISHTSTLYASAPQSNLAEKLASIAPGNLKKSFFTSSGTEANETAVAAARTYTGRLPLVVLRHSYSGRSAVTLAMCGQSNWKKTPNIIPGIHHAHAPYCYRCPFNLEYPSCGIKCAEDIEELIQTETGGEIAAFFAETVIGAGGFIVPPPGYFEKAAGIARKYGGLFISDEVQAAWGRTGDHMFGISHWKVTPDILTSAKGMGNGAPIGLTIATPEVADKYPGVTFATFGGNPVSCTSAHETIKFIEDNNLVKNCAVVGKHLGERFDQLKEKHKLVGDARGLGMMRALELVKDRKTKEPDAQGTAKVFEEAKKRGVLIGKGGVWGNVIRTGLMLNATIAQADELADAIDAGLTAAEA
jgi:4-aminobutyrate aminotransferase-like enzyme